MKEKAQENRDNNGSPKNTSRYSQQWKEEKDKSRWIEMSLKDEIRFIEEVRSHGHIYDPKSKENAPKKPCAPFLLYARAESKKLQTEMGISYKDALKILGARWKGDIDPAVKNSFVELSNKEKEQFENNQ